jgi:hypothetical protein
MIAYWALVVHALVATPLHAQGAEYPYCAQYADGTSLSCGFSSLSMCNESVSGVGGVCILNPRGSQPAYGRRQSRFYAPPPPPPLPLFGFGQSPFYAPVPPP